MALPSSGTLGMNQIRTELGIPGQAPFSLDTAENGGYVPINQCSPSKPNPSNPAKISEWYGYNHTAACYNVGGFAYTTTSCTASCNLGYENANLWSCCSTLAVNCRVWANSSCSTLPGVGYYSQFGTCYQVDDGGTVIAVTSCGTTTTSTTTTAAPSNCHNYQATASSFISYTDCCGVAQNYYILVGDTFCAQIGTVTGFYIDLGTNCYC